MQMGQWILLEFTEENNGIRVLDIRYSVVQAVIRLFCKCICK